MRSNPIRHLPAARRPPLRGAAPRLAALVIAVTAGVGWSLASPASSAVADADPCGGIFNVIVGTTGNDVLVGTPGRDYIDGRGGHDVIRGRGGDDVLIGGDGRDELTGGAGDDCLEGGNGNDHLYGDEDSTTIGNGDDTLDGGSGSDTAWLYEYGSGTSLEKAKH